MLILFLTGLLVGFGLGSCLVLYFIDRDFEIVKTERNEEK